MPFLFAKSQARRALRIGLPIFVAQLSQIGMNFADTIMSGHYSAEAMAAVAVDCSIWQPASLLAIGCLLALPGMSAQLIGARRCDRAAHLLKQGLLLSCFLSAILIPALWIISDHLGAFGLKPDLVPQARGYLRALLPGLPGFLFFVNIRSLLEGYSRTRPAMIIGMVCLAINIPCNYAFIYGRFGMPRLGAAGCGVATSICFWFMAVSIFYYVVRDVQFRDMRLFTPDHDSGTPFIDLPLILSVLRIGAPNAAAMCLECTLFAVTALLLAPLGTDASSRRAARRTHASPWPQPTPSRPWPSPLSSDRGSCPSIRQIRILPASPAHSCSSAPPISCLTPPRPPRPAFCAGTTARPSS